MAHESHQSKPGGGTLISNHGFCYPDLNPMNSFDANPELFTLQTGMEMLGLPPSKARVPEQHQQRNQFTWKGFTTTITTAKQETSRGTTTMDPTNHYYFSEPTSNDNLMVAPETGWSDPTSLQCVFNDRPSQGLSLRPPDVGFYASSSSSSMLGFSEAAAVAPPLPPSHHVQMRNSKYLVPAQELLNEFCSLGNSGDGGATKNKSRKTHQSDDGDSSRNQSLYSMDLLELQKRKARLLPMLEEVDGRYRHYCEQMKAVVSTFEAVAGEGTARVYSSLASKAMSRHFRCLRDGIVGQIKATNKAMREKDVAVPGASKGETPRLRVLDQTIRQQKAFQQMGLMESHPWRPQRGLPERSVSVLRAWLFEHFLHPYPSDVDKHILARQTGLSRSQVSNWFINARVRLWKPMVEEMYMEETKEQDILLGRLENNENNNNNDSRPNHHHLLHQTKTQVAPQETLNTNPSPTMDYYSMTRTHSLPSSPAPTTTTMTTTISS
ncbi:hypothetical protein QJS10_CPA03g02007 [Acorus calamus]|uniref:Homeobox domain-containing protein n=1 Tax=Acorus calamus TaxID=4465 RepID=A0AAV9F6U6_ACOCL|nr:hypothetical protein QJS10_CPA03g02007 [Acorus calamus]